MKYQITNQRELRREFWRMNDDLAFSYSRKRLADGDYPTDTRVAWCDFIDHLERDGIISEALAQRATL